ncbi:hypothetical protein GSbR_23650 [Geobacter sp. SVR]|nr:hypothetical protein GSbR_23650 [Geobacter sp. SVR]
MVAQEISIFFIIISPPIFFSVALPPECREECGANRHHGDGTPFFDRHFYHAPQQICQRPKTTPVAAFRHSGRRIVLFV